jgi:hypothetical protein
MAPMKNDSKVELVKRDDHYGLYDESGQKIAATLDGCKYKLSTENCDEIFGVVDVEKLAENKYGKGIYEIEQVDAYVEGFNKAMELNKDKLFTETDIRKAYQKGEEDSYTQGGLTKQKEDDYIQSLQQPTEIEVEIAVLLTERDGGVVIETPKLDKDGCLILKKK